MVRRGRGVTRRSFLVLFYAVARGTRADALHSPQLSPSALALRLYGVWPSETHTFEDQLGLVPGTKSKIEDGSDTGTSGGEVVTVADFR